MTSIRSAILYSSFSQYFLRILNLVSVMVFARLLTPTELGIYAIASSVAIIASEFRLLGTSHFLVREKDLPTKIIRSAIGLTMIISWSLGSIIFFLAPLISDIYEISELTIIFRILSASFFLAPFISVTSSLLTRDLHFKELLLIKLISQIFSFLSSLILVLLGYSFYGLAWGVFISVCIEFLMILRFKPSNASWRPRFKELKSIIRFGIYSSTTSMLNRLSTTVPDLIIGKMGTPTQVALFSRGVGFLTFLSKILVTGIKPVSLPYLSRIKRDGGDLSKAYLHATLLLGSICWPVLAVANTASYPLILLLFGDQWKESVPIAAILSLWAIFRIIHALSPSLLVAMENEGLMLFKQVIVSVATVTGIIIAFPYGLTAIAWSMVFAGVVEFLISGWAINRAIGLGLIKFIVAMRVNIILTLICWGAAKAIDIMINFNEAEPWVSIVYLALIVPPIWLGSTYLLSHPIFNEITRLAKGLIHKGN